MTTQILKSALEKEYKMEATVFPLGQDVIFLGTELECYRMAYRFKGKESRVSFSNNLGVWFVSFPEWFDAGFAQRIVK